MGLTTTSVTGCTSQLPRALALPALLASANLPWAPLSFLRTSFLPSLSCSYIPGCSRLQTDPSLFTADQALSPLEDRLCEAHATPPTTCPVITRPSGMSRRVQSCSEKDEISSPHLFQNTGGGERHSDTGSSVSLSVNPSTLRHCWELCV